MIRLHKGPAPTHLIRHGRRWQAAFLQAIHDYGGYEAVPSSVFTPLKRYRDAEIVTALFSESYGKCCYCESHLTERERDVEHFLPKPIYPERAFSWENLLPVCRPCNEAKANEDVGRHPIVNPTSEDPSLWFTFVGAEMQVHPNAPDRGKAQRTIDLLNLNRVNLREQRQTWLAHLTPKITAGADCPFSACTRAWRASHRNGLGIAPPFSKG